ncbi:MAG: hypothetical protein A2086_03950 [Spirochaetes bacterium GWD1_27_9]|nr:MAG: hypothetical protein A2Z98_01535 [Spirochaetes bacterium GWB1_27_13]OHD25639.1 MAG: hypothetical protein A2Y34_07840 [Spirochaetes bacterium GWC1_27_15]OHD36166.1 MAG: hypothetical protein A2086_03950 [Spirochaetes bacterium GWD1_27_9]
MSEKQFKLVFDGYWKDASVSKVPEKSGIYCVYTGTIDVLNQKPKLMIHRLLFIGDSDNANVSVQNHEKSGDLRKYIGDRQILCYSFAPLEKEFRERVKLALIQTHNPPGNPITEKKYGYEKTIIKIEGQNTLLKKEVTIEP